MMRSSYGIIVGFDTSGSGLITRFTVGFTSRHRKFAIVRHSLPTGHPWAYYHPHTPLVTVLHSWCATAVLR